MKTPLLLAFAVATLALAAASTPSEQAQPSAQLRAGAAKVDITPAANANLPMSGYASRVIGFTGIHDDLNVRAIVVDDGAAQAAIVSMEVISLSHALWEKFSQRLQRETGIPPTHLLLAAVHTHAAPALLQPDERPANDLAQRRADYTARLEDAIVTAVRQAQTNLQPARIGFGAGEARVNMNRRARNGEGGWMLGNNPDGPSDKTVAVLKLETATGEPLAIFSNYAVHGTVLGAGNLQISSDLPGAAARYVEKHYGGRVVSPWTSAAAGDQDPIYRIGTDFRNVSALGEILGEEVVRVAESIRTSPRGRIRAFQTVVNCPGKRTVQRPGPGTVYRAEDADPVPLRLSLLVINDVALAGVSGEVLTNIGLRLKRESPLTRTLMITNCNGASGYLPDDAAYDQVSYEIMASRVKRGHAESAIVGGFLDLMARLF